jgi:NAD(P)-dependent dehydrogenase (short-subunit alcohol dehydrogenase family)
VIAGICGLTYDDLARRLDVDQQSRDGSFRRIGGDSMAGILDGKVAFVTGGSSGIGRASALAYAKAGAKVAILDINPDGGQVTLDAIKAIGGQAIFIKGDVSLNDEVAAAVAQTVQTFGRLDIAFNNAGVEGPIMIATADFPRDEWDRILAVDLTGVWLCMKHQIPQMLNQGGGAIVNMSSVAGLAGDVLIGAAYHSAKFGVIGLTKTAALEYIKKNIRINCVCPGFIDTPMVQGYIQQVSWLKAKLEEIQPIGRLGNAEEVAALVVWLSSDQASFVVGDAVSVDGGILG